MNNQSVPYFILETSQVPFGHEPTVVLVEPSYEKALETVEFLNIQHPDCHCELCEA